MSASRNLPEESELCPACGQGPWAATNPVRDGFVTGCLCAPHTKLQARVDAYRRVVEMWASYRFRCSDTPSPALLDKLLVECDDATTTLIARHGFKYTETELFKS